MPTSTYDLIASNVLTSSASSVTFSSIPATYRDLVLVCEIKHDVGGAGFGLQLNNDTGSNYSYVYALGDGSSTASVSGTLSRAFSGGPVTSEFGNRIFQIMDYSATDKHKSILSRSNQPSANTIMIASRWANTAAVNEIDLILTSGNFVSGSTFYLYGIVS